MIERRAFLTSLGALAALSVPAVSRAGDAGRAHVVVVGGGYGGATAAKYIRLFSKGSIRVTLIEPEPRFVSCPLSNLVLEGRLTIDEVSVTYAELQHRYGITIVRDRVRRIDPAARRVALEHGESIGYDRVVVSPGIDFMWDEIPGMRAVAAREKILHAWTAGAQTVALRRQLQAMRDGGRFVIAVPLAPYRCPPAPYERACMVASYFKKYKPRSKVLVFDANAGITSKGALFKAAWQEHYSGIIDYVPQFKAVDINVARDGVIFEFGEEVVGDVINLIPPMRAGQVAVDAGLASANDRWCEVDFLTFESIVVPGVHVLGDAIQVAPIMPKSGHMANQHGKTCAAAVTALLSQRPVNARPIYSNTCYSFVTDAEAMHVATVHRYDALRKTMLTVPEAGGLSSAASRHEGETAMSWAKAIWSDMLL